MSRLLSTLSFLALVAAPLSLAAQETQTEAPAAQGETQAETQIDTQAEAPSDDIPNPNALPTGEDASDEAPIGSAYLREVNGDWAMECLRIEEGTEEPCQLFQALKDGNDNLVANVRIFKLKDAGKAVAGGLIAVPLETLLTAQMTITVDNGKPQRYPFSVCDPLGCYARIGLTQADIDSFKRGAKATIGIVPFVKPDERLQLPMSLKGFTASYDKATTMP